MTKKINNFVYWTPRILGIVFILFLAVFSFDVFDGNYGFWGTALALFMHNIPSLVLLIVVIVAWKRELVGAIAFILAGLLYTFLCIARYVMSTPAEWYMLLWSMIIAVPAFLVGILFLIGWYKKRK